MASTIIIKNGAGSSVPSSLKQGELALNVDNGKLFFGTSGSSNAVSSSFSFQHITASGEVSASAGLISTTLTLATNGVNKSTIDDQGNITANNIQIESDLQHVGDTNNKISFGTDTQDFQTGGSSRLDISDSGIRLGGANSRVTTILDEDNMASDSATSLATQQSIKAYVDANAGGSVSGNTFATDLKIGRDADNLIDFTTDNQVTFRVSAGNGVVMKASGEVSSSSTGSFRALNITDDGVAKFNVDTNGHVSASGDISSSATLLGTDIELKSAGVHKASIDTSGNITAEGAISGSGQLTATNLQIETNGAVRTTIDASGNLFAASLSASGVLNANTAQFANNGVNTLNVSNAGAISASSTIQGTAFTAQTNGATKATIDASGNISASGAITTATLIGHGTDTILASDGKISASGDLLGNSATFSNNGINTLNISNAGAISASSTIQGTAFTAQTNGDTKATIDASGNISGAGALTANSFNITNNGDNVFSVTNAGAISASSTIAGTTLTLATNGAVRSTIDASGNLFAGGDISSSGELHGNSIALTNNGDNVFSVSNAGAVSASGELAGTSLTLKVNGLDRASIDTSGDFTCRTISGSGQLTANAAQFENNGINTLNISTAGAISASSTIQGTALTLQDAGINTLTVDTIGNVSSSATGSFRALTIADDGVTQAAIDAEGGITGSKFQGTQHLLHTGTIYINDDPFVQNSVYLGNSTGNQPRNWNDPQASGGTLGTQTTINISEDDTRWGMILPCDVSQVEIQCSLRPGGACTGDNFFVGLYTAARPNNGGANYDITLVAHNDSTFAQGKYTTNDFTHTAIPLALKASPTK